MTIKARKTSELAHAATGGQVRLPALLRSFWLWSGVVFGLTIAVAWVEYRAGYTALNYNPLGDPLFGDLMEYPGTYQWLHTTAFFFNVPGAPLPYPLFSPVAYPPFAAMVMAGLYSAASPVLRYLEVTAVWLVAAVWGVRRALMRVGIGGVTATLFPLTMVAISFPIARLMHEGNVELALWILTATGVWAYLKDSRGGDDAAAVLWGLAAAMKLYPAVLLILFLPRGRWRAFAVGVATFAGATVLALWWLGPTMGVAWRGSLQNVFGYQGLRASEWSLRELAANHSAYTLVKLAAMMTGVPLARLTLPYYGFGAVAMGWAFFGRLWRMPEANQLLAVTAFMVMFPPVSYFHTLVHLYAPLLVLLFVAIRAERAGVQVRGLKLTVLLFVPLFASWTLFTIPRAFIFDGLVQAALLVALFGCAMRYPFAVEEMENPSAG
ncbi:MAG: glycosyltransferase family 87 protein [Acidobacteriaceae bacterium]